MWRLPKIAWRNLIRHPRRTFFNGLGTATGVAVIVFLGGFFDGFRTALIAATVQARTGGVQLHRRGFLSANGENASLDLAADPAFLDRLRHLPGVQEVAPRLVFDALLNNGELATAAHVTAIDPTLDARVCPERHSQESGGHLRADHPEGIILGAELAQSLGLHLGASATLLATTQPGDSNALDVSVAGELDSPLPFTSKRTAVVTLALAQRLLKMPNRANEIVIRPRTLADAAAVAKVVQSAAGPDSEAVTWAERDRVAAQLVARARATEWAVTVVLFLLVGGFVANAMVAAFDERRSELGTMLALGLRRRDLLTMALVEAALLATGAAIAGGLIAASAIYYVHAPGLPLSIPGGKTTLIHPTLAASTFAQAFVAAIVSSVVAALSPAWHASRLTPVEALRAV